MSILVKGNIIEVKIGNSPEWWTIVIDDVEKSHISVKRHSGNGWANHRYHKRLIKDARFPAQN